MNFLSDRNAKNEELSDRSLLDRSFERGRKAEERRGRERDKGGTVKDFCSAGEKALGPSPSFSVFSVLWPPHPRVPSTPFAQTKVSHAASEQVGKEKSSRIFLSFQRKIADKRAKARKKRCKDSREGC